MKKKMVALKCRKYDAFTYRLLFIRNEFVFVTCAFH